MIQHLQQHQLQQIVDFLKDNYETDVEFLVPDDINELVKMYGNHDYFAVSDNYGIEALCFVNTRYVHVAEISSVVVRLDVRKSGLTRQLSEVVENSLHSGKVKKIIGYIATTNKKSVIMAIKRNYIIEGTLRNQDGKGTDYYIMGKEL